MWDVGLYGIFALDAAQNHKVVSVPLLEIMRAPTIVNAGILGVVLVLLFPQPQVRTVLTFLSLTCLVVITGMVFTSLLMIACIVVFVLSRFLQPWSVRRQNPVLPMSVGWLIIHAMYIPAMFTVLPPFQGTMGWGELTQFWGIAFIVLKSLHYVRIACMERVNPFETGAFRKFLYYMIHFPSFWLGPYQTFRQFDDEVSTCKQRISWRNSFRGLTRIGIGAVKILIIFHWINRAYFYPNGYFGPLAEALFVQAEHADIGHLWFMYYLFTIRACLFISAVSDGVIGMNLMMGIRVPENSNWPLFSRDIIEFWRRWNIQVGVFLRDEVFFPVGGVRKRYLGYFFVFAYCGLWHYVSLSAVFAFASLQVAAFAATHFWDDFWQRHQLQNDWIHTWGERLFLYDSPLSRVLGAAIVLNLISLSSVFVLDHKYGGTTMLPRMLGW